MMPNLSCIVYSTCFFKQHSVTHRIADFLITTSKLFFTEDFPHVYRKLSKYLCYKDFLLKKSGTVRLLEYMCMKYMKISSIFYYMIDYIIRKMSQSIFLFNLTKHHILIFGLAYSQIIL